MCTTIPSDEQRYERCAVHHPGSSAIIFTWSFNSFELVCAWLVWKKCFNLPRGSPANKYSFVLQVWLFIVTSGRQTPNVETLFSHLLWLCLVSPQLYDQKLPTLNPKFPDVHNDSERWATLWALCRPPPGVICNHFYLILAFIWTCLRLTSVKKNVSTDREGRRQTNTLLYFKFDFS
jgi:hypothetical protein